MSAGAEFSGETQSVFHEFRGFGTGHTVHAGTRYHIELYDSQNRLKWTDEFDNLVTTQGRNTLLTAMFVEWVTNPAWAIGLIDGATEPVYDADDVLGADGAGHDGWTEFTDYTENERQAFTPGTVADGSVDNVANRAVFTIGANGTIAGCFLADQTAFNDEGTLYGEGTFAGGARPVEIGDSLRVTAAASITVD